MTISRRGVAAICVLCLAVGATLGPTLVSATSKGFKNVIVRNTATAPVPVAVQGTTHVDGTVSVGNQPQVSVANQPQVSVANQPDVNVANQPEVKVANQPAVTVANEPQVTVANKPKVTPVPEHFQISGTLSGSGTLGACTAELLGPNVPAGRTVVLKSLDVDASDSVKPEAVAWLRQQTGAPGFFTHFLGVPLQSFSVNGLFSGHLDLNERMKPGGTAAGDLSDLFFCIAPGSGDSATTARYIFTGFLE